MVLPFYIVLRILSLCNKSMAFYQVLLDDITETDYAGDGLLFFGNIYKLLQVCA